VGGDSAGSALAVAVSLAQRDASQTQPAALVLLSPWTDLAFTGPSFLASESRDPWMSGPRLRRSAGLYLGSGDAKDPRASPLYADLHGLPPLLIQVGGDEVLLDDATRFAQRAATAGVAVDLEVGEGLWHVWPLFAPALPEGRVALQRIGSWMRSRPGWG
jgi:epsilon-lactone hydrolase